MFQIANPLKILKTAAIIFIMVAACYAPVQAHPGHLKARKHGGHGFRDCPWRMVPYHGHFVGRHICGAGNF